MSVETRSCVPSRVENAGIFVVELGGRGSGTGTYLRTGGSTRVEGELSASDVKILGGILTGSGKVDPPSPISATPPVTWSSAPPA